MPENNIDKEAERLLSDIQNTSSFVLRAELTGGVDDIDPDDAAPAVPTIAADAKEQRVPLTGAGEADAASVDEASAVIASEMQNAIREQEQELAAEDAAQAKRSRLSHALVAVIVVLILAAVAVAGFVVYTNLNAARSGEESGGSTQLAANDDGEQAAFTAVDTSNMAPIATLYGKTIEEVKDATSGTLVIEDSLEKADSDAPLSSIAYWAEAQFITSSGVMTGSCIMGLNKDKRLVYTYNSFDLDALDVADADFAELAANGTVAASVLAGLGVAERAIDASELAASELPAEKDDVQTLEFTGDTGLGGDPQTWELSESYDKSVGKTVGDNSVIRTLVVELY